MATANADTINGDKAAVQHQDDFARSGAVHLRMPISLVRSLMMKAM